MNVELLVNGAHNPIGVQSNCIRFSWRYAQEYAQFHQTAYRIQVSTKKQVHTGDLWDSGWVNSANNLNIPSDTTEYPVAKPIFWAVTLKDENGAQYPCGPASFIVQPKRWKAKWIWKSSEVHINDVATFKKKFNLNGSVDHAHIYISAHSQYKLWINGCQVGGYVSPAPTNPRADKRFLGFDISPYLRVGENEIKAAALFQGGSGQNFVDGKPGFFCEAHIQIGKKHLCIESGADWQTALDTNYESRMPYQQNRRITAVEHFDNRKHEDEIVWKNAVCVKGPCPVNILKLQTIPEGIIERRISPLCLRSEKGIAVYDAGCIISGWVKLQIREAYGTKICIRYSENLNEAGRVGHNVANETSENYCDYFTAGASFEEEWSPCFSYKAFRYFEITGHQNPVTSLVEVVHTGITRVGSFNCDNILLNQIYEACIQTQKNNTLGQLVDCPHREQAQYLADSDVQSETLLYNFDAACVAEKVLSDFASAQQKNGTFPFVYPSNYRHKDFKIHIPEWDLHYCTLLWKLYFLTGDVAYLHHYYAPCKAMVDYYLAQRSEENGLVPQSKHWHISDWPYPNVDHSGKYLGAENIKIYHNVCLMRKMADILDRAEETQWYASEQKKLYHCIRNELLDTQAGLYRDSVGSSCHSTGVNALALCYDLFEQHEIPQAVRYLEESPWESSTLLTLNVLQALFNHGSIDTAYRMISADTERGWGVMIKKGYGTMWEGFSDIESHSHAWNGYPARLFAEYLVGIRCVAPGFSHVELKPCFPKEMKHLAASVNTPQGKLYVKWERCDKATKLYLEVPYGIHVDVFAPNGENGYIYQSTVSSGKQSVYMSTNTF